jgi:hypothetical protein
MTKESWLACNTPKVSDIIRWREPLWDKPNKPRGKPDKIGEQAITAKVVTAGDLLELRVIDMKRLSLAEGAKGEPAKIKKDDMIRRKIASIRSGECQKLSQKT